MKITIDDIREYKENAIVILEEESQYATAKAVEMAFNALISLDQIKWERDIAIEQLEELGLSLGQKIDGVYITKEEYDRLLECVDKRYKYGKNLFVGTQFR